MILQVLFIGIFLYSLWALIQLEIAEDDYNKK